MPSLRVSLMITLLSKAYFEKVIGLLEQMNIAELVPTEELVELFTACLDSKSSLLQRITSHVIIYSDWALLFTMQPSYSQLTIALLLKTVLFIASDSYPIERVESANIQLRGWREFDWAQLSNDQLATIFTDFSSGLSIDSFIHPSSCHVIALDLIKSACLQGSGNSIELDINRRRVWTGALSRLLRRSDVHNLAPTLKSRITGFLEEQIIWIGTGCPGDKLEELVAAPWSDLFQILNVDDRYQSYLLNTLNEQTELTILRLFILTASKTLRDPAIQMKIIETSIHRALDLGHGFSLLHGTLCSLPIYFRKALEFKRYLYNNFKPCTSVLVIYFI